MKTIAARRLFSSRSRSFTGIAAIIAAFGLLGATLTLILVREQSYREQQVEQVQVQAKIFAASVTAALAFDDRRSAQDYVNALGASPQLRAAAVYNNAGARIAAFSREKDSLLPRRAPMETLSFDGDDVVVVAAAEQGLTQLGYVALRTQLEGVERRMARYSIVAALILMTALVLGTLAAGQRSLARANRSLADANSKLTHEMAEREKVEEVLRQSQKMEAIGQLAGGIAHDFNNLLGVIQGNLHLLRKRVAQGGTDIEKYLGATGQALARAATLTQRILAYSRRQPLSPKEVDLSELVSGMTELLKHSVNERVTLELRLEARWHVTCDPSQMENVLLNLANNAGDAMPDGGRLLIATTDVTRSAMHEVPAGDYVELKVIDSGVGMDEETRKRATDPFFTTKPLGRGTGLGLSTALGYVHQSKGFLTIESALGDGATVTILMPRRRAIEDS